MQCVIKTGLIVDPAQRTAMVGDLILENDRILQIAHPSMEREPNPRTLLIDARGCLVVPGFVDLAADVGTWNAPTLDDALDLALRGGWTTLGIRPDVVPALDSPQRITALRNRPHVPMHSPMCVPLAPLRAPDGSLHDLKPFVTAGAVAATDRDHPISDPQQLRGALHRAAALDLPVLLSPHALNWAGVMHAGQWSAELGVRGIPGSAETAAVAQILALIEETRARVHLLHITTAASVRLIRHAKRDGSRVTASTTPQHLVLTDRWVAGSLADDRDMPQLNPALLSPYDRRVRFSPPLRSEADRKALVTGLLDGTLDAIASDHHTWQAGPAAFGTAEPGVPMWDSALALLLVLVQRGELDVVELVARLSFEPARILGLPCGTFAPHAVADVTIFDTEATWALPHDAASPVAGQTLKGRVMLTMRAGEVVYRHNNFGSTHRREPMRAATLAGLL